MSALLSADEAARLTLGVNVIVRPGDDQGASQPLIVAPQDWVALTGPCPEPDCRGGVIQLPEWEGHTEPCPQPHARDGRRIVPLYTECPKYGDTHIGGVKGTGRCEHTPPCHHGLIRVGAGSIAVVPVVDGADVPEPVLFVRRGTTRDWVHLIMADGEVDGPMLLDPSPVPGHDFGIVIDCVELS